MRFTQQGSTLSVLAPAKLNLSLKILGRRQDGYHDLQTLMVSVRLYDTLQFTPADPGVLSLESHACGGSLPALPLDDRNLIIKAARLLQAETGCQLGAAVSLWKRIPSEAGLGGGSSDAAATLVALNQLWKLKLTSQKLHQLAAQLGSDVNFFLDSQCAAKCSGRGEKTEPICLHQPLHAVIVKPPTGLSTAQVFQQWTPDGESRSDSTTNQAMRCFCCGPRRPLRDVLSNDLEAPARRLNSEIDHLLSRLSREDVWMTGMTGSGSACFALCRTARHAHTIASRARQWRMGLVFSVQSGV